MIRELKLWNFKGFRRFSLTFDNRNVLVGPNNTGKSTLIGAIRTCAAMVRHASSRNPPRYYRDRGIQRRGYPLSPGQFDLEEENLRYEFGTEETRIELRFKGGATIRAVWPEDEYDPPFFYAIGRNQAPIITAGAARAAFPKLGTIPILTPIDHRERVRTRETVMRQLYSRLASRHFRNQLLLLQGADSDTHSSALEEFLEYCRFWLPEVTLEPPLVRREDEWDEIDVFFREGRTPKEIAWAGDGFQVFFQLLLHVFRLRDAPTVVLDEPDVYLHPDFQVRLLRLLDTLNGQVLITTHSPEVVVESPASSVLWIDRNRSSAVRTPDAATLSEMSAAIGSHFNLKLARVLRARIVVFVEGKDLNILRNLAMTVGATALVTQWQIAVIPIEGSANWRRLEGFSWVAGNLLEDAVTGYIILDSDYHTAPAVQRLRRDLREIGLEPHIWNRKELESYLLEPAAISRVSGAPEALVVQILAGESDKLRTEVISGMIAARNEEREERHLNVANAARESNIELERYWDDPRLRLNLCPAKDLLSALNRRLQAEGFKAVSAYALSKELRIEEIPEEMARVLHRISELAVRTDE